MNIVEPDSAELTERQSETQSVGQDLTHEMYGSEAASKRSQGITNIQTTHGEVEFMVSPPSAPGETTVHVTSKL